MRSSLVAGWVCLGLSFVFLFLRVALSEDLILFPWAVSVVMGVVYFAEHNIVREIRRSRSER